MHMIRIGEIRIPRLLIIIIPVIVLLLIIYFNSIMAPASMIRSQILRKTPIGTSMGDVIQYIEKKEKWRLAYVSNEYGYVDRDQNKVGSQSVGADIGSFYVMFEVLVTVEWGFDSDSKLIDVMVVKSANVM